MSNSKEEFPLYSFKNFIFTINSTSFFTIQVEMLLNFFVVIPTLLNVIVLICYMYTEYDV